MAPTLMRPERMREKPRGIERPMEPAGRRRIGPIRPEERRRMEPERPEEREKGVLSELAELAGFKGGRRPMEGELAGREEMDREAMEKEVVEQSFKSGSLLPYVAFKEEQRQQRLKEIEAYKEMFAHSEVVARLRRMFSREKALAHAKAIHQEILEHPQTLLLLKAGVQLRSETRTGRAVMGENEANWAAWAGQHRLQLLDKIIAGAGMPMQPRADIKTRKNESRPKPG